VYSSWSQDYFSQSCGHRHAALHVTAGNRVRNEIMSAIHRGKNIDLRFAVNNSSKRPLPDFGSGRCESTITNAGPTIFLPAKGGIDVHFDPSVFSSCSKAQRLEALQAFKALPKKFK